MIRSAIIAALVVAAGAYADSVSLTNDFSLTNGNPNGQWTYSVGATLGTATPLSLQVPQNNGNAAYPALATGYWGTGNDLNTNTPDFGKALVNGSAAGETNKDFLAGDIIAHSPNPDGTALWITWTAPSAGQVTDLNFEIWYAHSAVDRSNDFRLFEPDGNSVFGTVSPSGFFDRDHAYSATDPAGFSVNAGDEITIELGKSSGQSVGSLDGMSLDFTFDPAASTPEPASILLGCSGLMLVLCRRRAHKRIN